MCVAVTAVTAGGEALPPHLRPMDRIDADYAAVGLVCGLKGGTFEAAAHLALSMVRVCWRLLDMRARSVIWSAARHGCLAWERVAQEF